jgi:hypothetical protein
MRVISCAWNDFFYLARGITDNVRFRGFKINRTTR